MDSVAIRIEKSIELSGCKTRKEFSELIGVTPDALKKWENREGGITANGILKITSKIPISRTYLEDGEGDPYLRDDTGTSNYLDEGRIEKMLEMFREIEPEDQEIVYQIIKRCHLRLDMKPKKDDFDLKF